MVATPDIIPTDLTLEIGDDISPERFVAAARAFFGYVNELAKMLAPDGDEPHWRVLVRDGSSLLAVEAPNAAPEILNAIYTRAEEGLYALVRGSVEDSNLSEPALRHAKTLSGLSEGTKDRPLPLRLWVRRKPVDVKPEIARVIEEDWRADYNDFGTIEGRLETIQDHEGSLRLQVRDALFRQNVRCYFSEEKLPLAFSAFRKRVEVSGIIHYRKNGTPISIEVSQIDTLPDDSELPTADEVRGLFKAAI
jgi:hypothetical protein